MCEQRQSPGGILSNRCSWDFWKTHKKTPLMEPIFSIVLDRTTASFKMALYHRCFLWISQNSQEHLFGRKPPGDCFCLKCSYIVVHGRSKDIHLIYDQKSSNKLNTKYFNGIQVKIKTLKLLRIQRCQVLSNIIKMWQILLNSSFYRN